MVMLVAVRRRRQRTNVLQFWLYPFSCWAQSTNHIHHEQRRLGYIVLNEMCMWVEWANNLYVPVYACMYVLQYVFVMSHTYAIRIDNDYLLSDTKMNEFLICVIGLFSRICHFLMIQAQHTYIHALAALTSPQITQIHIGKQKHDGTRSKSIFAKCCRQHFHIFDHSQFH